MYQSDVTFIEVILPLAVGKTFTYRVKKENTDAIQNGIRVTVPFGKSKIYSGIVYSIHHQAPLNYEAKYILEILDSAPIVATYTLKFWDWIAEYYICSIGEVMAAALPSAFKVNTSTKVVLKEDIIIDIAAFNDYEYLVIEALEIEKQLSIEQIEKILNQKNIFPLLHQLYDKGYIEYQEDDYQTFKPKKIEFLQLHPNASSKEGLEAAFKQVERAPKQTDALLHFLQLNKNRNAIEKSLFISNSNVSTGIIKELVDKKIFTIEAKEYYQAIKSNIYESEDFKFNDAQQIAYTKVQAYFENQKNVLLHGVTSSGKTLIYIECIKNVLKKGQQALILIPEIALTTQLVERFKKHFGNQVAVYHSKYGTKHRAQLWQGVQNGSVQIVIGARSAIFLPFTNLGLIVVDEEHESSYKQQDPQPRYHARDLALYLSSLNRFNVLLGSATPSAESYYNAEHHKIGLVELTQKYSGIQEPEIICIDLKKEGINFKQSETIGPKLLKAIQDTINEGKQVVLFQNRRGYAPVIQCNSCGYAPQCKNCDIALTYHKYFNQLECHYCGYHTPIPVQCPICFQSAFSFQHFGTEKIEEELKDKIPSIQVARMDLDTTRRKRSIEELLLDFSNNKIQVLIGTQMVAKGLDFDNLQLIGVINANALINFPDFRANERAIQLLTQVCGRAGRRNHRGKMLIQTTSPEHLVLNHIQNHNYSEYIVKELIEREAFNYPPYVRLINIRFKHAQKQLVEEASTKFFQILKQYKDIHLVGPTAPLVSRIRNQYIRHLLVKIPRNIDLGQTKKLLSEHAQLIKQQHKLSQIIIQFDVDPYF